MCRSAGRSRICLERSSQANANYGVTAGIIPASSPAYPFVPFKAFQIVEPGAQYVERLNQIDFRVSKILRFGTTRTNLNFDFFNVTNSNSVIGENFTYGPAWRATDIDRDAAPVQDQRAV